MPPRKPEQEKEVLDWIQAVLGEPVPDGEFEEVLICINSSFAIRLKIKIIKNSTYYNIQYFFLGFEKWSGSV